MGRYIDVFLDTEFTGLSTNAKLLSIGMVTSGINAFYAEFNDYGMGVSKWVADNVIPNMVYSVVNRVEPNVFSNDNGSRIVSMKSDRSEVVAEIRKWLTQDVLGDGDKAVFWSDCLAYDWVLFCDLFGGALTLPEYIYYIPFDLATLMNVRGIDPDISRVAFSQIDKEDYREHNSLFDAAVIRECYNRINRESSWTTSTNIEKE